MCEWKWKNVAREGKPRDREEGEAESYLNTHRLNDFSDEFVNNVVERERGLESQAEFFADRNVLWKRI